jgi:hypothetical protein
MLIKDQYVIGLENAQRLLNWSDKKIRMLLNSKDSQLKHEKKKWYSKLNLFRLWIVYYSNVLSWF